MYGQDRAAAFCFSFEGVESPEAAALPTHAGLSLSCHHLGSHQNCDSPSVPCYRAFLLIFSPNFFSGWQQSLYKHCQSPEKVETIQTGFNNYCKCPSNLVNRAACIYTHNKHKHRQPPHGCLEVSLPFPKKVTGNRGLPANMQHLALQYSCNGFLIFTALDLTQLSLRILIALAFSKTFPRWLFEEHIQESKC